jgi:hydrogenase nickel incorporation protein HypB
MLSITEGPYMVKKHPLTIKRSDMVVINKIDLADVLEFDVDALVNDVREVDAKLPVFKVSSKTGAGLDELIDALEL